MRILLPLALLLAPLAACGGSNASSVPLQLVLPVPPEPRTASPHCPKSGEPALAPAPRGPASMRPPATRIPVPAAVQALVDAPDRDEEDRKLDAGRHPGDYSNKVDAAITAAMPAPRAAAVILLRLLDIIVLRLLPPTVGSAPQPTAREPAEWSIR